MVRKLLVIAVTMYLGKVTSGWIALGVLSAITSVALFLQLTLSPFPSRDRADFDPDDEDAGCMEKSGCGRLILSFMRAVQDPSLNHLALAGLCCQVGPIAHPNQSPARRAVPRRTRG